jgi:septal ring factor EnvC (AmiA/AmiB activator)
VIPDREGKPQSVRYEPLNAMLLNEFLKEHRKVEKQQSKLEERETMIEYQQKQIDALTASCRKRTHSLKQATERSASLTMCSQLTADACTRIVALSWPLS